jgi:hypothetical protein
MSSSIEKAQSRRNFFKSALRYAALGGLGAIAGGTIAKNRRLAKQGICINRELCRKCTIFSECTLPAALYAKANVKENR